jgi:beta-lactamase superfamily II metal-dependent hydrolase
MAGELLVRMYNVELGDCIYLRIPDADREVHVLIDCGNKFGALELLGQRLRELKPLLPDDGAGGKRLDLLVVTHPHEDHHKGFEEDFLQGIRIERIWLSPAYDRENPKAKGFQALKDAALRGLRGLSQTALGELQGEVAELVLSLSKSEALTMLNETLPKRFGMDAPLYVTAQTPAEKLLTFQDPKIVLSVLAPMEDIDAYYVGGKGQQDPQAAAGSQGMADGFARLFPDQPGGEAKQPVNISAQDFRRLRSRIGASALAAAELAGHTENNLSVVLLLDWHGQRLLFPGDAEWSGSFGAKVQKGRSNGSWNVMWQEQRAQLSEKIHFLKIGHHGSVNATPWAPPNPQTGAAHPISEILDRLMPRPAAGEQPIARAIASTERTSRWPSIPDPALMEEIGNRIANSRTQYVEDLSRTHVEAGKPQPQRTDLEAQVTGAPVPYIELSFAR